MWIFQSRQIITRADKSSSSYLVSLLIFIILLSLDITLSFVERACPIRVQSIESWAKAVTPSTKLCYVPPFPGLLSSFFSLIDSEFSEQANRQVATEEPKKYFEQSEQRRKSSKKKRNGQSEFWRFSPLVILPACVR